MGEYHLIVEPVGGGQYRASINDTIILKSSAQPLLDGARALAKRGATPDSVITTRHRGAPTWSLKSTVGVASKLRVTTSMNGSLRFANLAATVPGMLTEASGTSETE